MGTRALVDRPVGPALGATRTRVLQLLRATEAPVSVREIAATTGLHPNTVRFHLDGLVDAGFAEWARESGNRPGRPRVVYHATPHDVATGQRSFRLLAEMLTSLINSAIEKPTHTAVEAGRAWGRYLVDRPAPSHRVDATDALERLTRMLTETGFGVDAVTETDTPVLALRQCPFREIAEGNREVVCSLHLGMLQGALEEVHAPLAAESLEPFVEPSLCLARLEHASNKPSASQQPSDA